MILVDTSIWIDHIRVANPQLGLLLMQGMVNQHPFVTAELALGSLANRGEVIGQLRLLPQAKVVGHEDLMVFLEGADLSAKGIGLVDAQVLASTVQTPNARLWTRDRRLLAQADRLGVAFDAMKRIPTQMRGGGGLRDRAAYGAVPAAPRSRRSCAPRTHCGA